MSEPLDLAWRRMAKEERNCIEMGVNYGVGTLACKTKPLRETILMDGFALLAMVTFLFWSPFLFLVLNST